MIAALLFAFQPVGTSGDQPEWPGALATSAEAPYGYVHDDGGEWIALQPLGEGPRDYLILARDYRARYGIERVAWFAVLHQRDRTVPYRVTRVQISVNCRYLTIQELFLVRWNADGTRHSDIPYATRRDPVVPGSISETFAAKLCDA